MMGKNKELEEISGRFIIGLDLGTTNSAVTYIDLMSKDPRRIRHLEIPQLVAPGQVGYRAVLPSFLYLPGSHELPAGTLSLPWNRQEEVAVGEFALEQGALVPGRLVSSAKSWLCHAGVDRTAAILPWGAETGVHKVSPVQASARYLRHIREAWNNGLAGEKEEYRFEEQLIILTVPASFDEVARELTLQAAREAGIPRVVLVEEPLAAFYAWLSEHEGSWEQGMEPGQIILVCDVGGGTTDFSLMAVRPSEKGLRFDRLAVGDHLMLGGDNMDMTLARHLEVQLLGQAGKLDSRRWHQLAHQCRKAKEILFSESAAHGSVDITIMGTGVRLIGDTLKGVLTFDLVRELILDGFFPSVPLAAHSKKDRRTGLTEWGLPYVRDPAVTRHLADFWQSQLGLMRRETGREALFPDFVLFNGGTLTPAVIRERICEVVRGWFRAEAGEDWSPVELQNPHPELAVAIGAAYYGLVRSGLGIRVGAGSPRSYYVEVASDGGRPSRTDEEPAVVGEEITGENFRAVCLVPRGTEEGSEISLEKPSFEVLANQPVEFRMFSSSTRLGDRLGEIVELFADEITSLPPIRTVLRFGKKNVTTALPVQLTGRLTEIGVLELWCRSLDTPHGWRLQFDIRQEKDPSALAAGETLEAEVIEQAQEKIRRVFRENSSSPESLTKDLVSATDLPKEEWPVSLIRTLADTLLENKAGREKTFQHEARWFNLLGFCLRPGFGDPIDEWRMKEVWKLQAAGPVFPKKVSSRSQWWIFWRRVAGGLNNRLQAHFYRQVVSLLNPAKKKGTKALPKPAAQEELELWMALANFERLPVENKVDLGRLLLEKIKKGKPKAKELWALSRLGARVPFYGPLDRVVPTKEVSRWIDELLALETETDETFLQGLIQMARYTGDRERDLAQEVRERISERLIQLPRGGRLMELLNNPGTVLEEREQDWVFGESLPAGLRLSTAREGM